MATPIEERISKLPHWAQDELNRRAWRVRELEQLLADVQGKRGQTAVRQEYSRGGSRPDDVVYLDQVRPVIFETERGTFQVKIEHGAVRVTLADFNGRMAVAPCVANVVELLVVKD